MAATAKAKTANEKPILFSGPMVRAILKGRKTQTRRVMRKQPIVAFWMGSVPQFQSTGYVQDSRGYSRGQLSAFSPYGKPGDRLWVRETFGAYAPEGQEGNWKTGKNVTYVYRADNENADVARWYPCIFLPRRASRLTLEIINIRVERLQEISTADAFWEGMNMRGVDGDLRHAGDHPSYSLLEFQQGWDKLNAKRGYSWESNPWVWVIEFKRVGQPST